MKVTYIAHPISGDLKGNMTKIIQIIRHINLSEPDTVPFAPYLSDLLALDDDNPEERERGIANDIYWLRSGFINEVRLYGHKVSSGMQAEIEIANEMNIPVVAMSRETLQHQHRKDL